MCVLYFCGAAAEQCKTTDNYVITDAAYCPDGYIETADIDAAKACDDMKQGDEGENHWVCVPNP